jgi:hypothetical protein
VCLSYLLFSLSFITNFTGGAKWTLWLSLELTEQTTDQTKQSRRTKTKAWSRPSGGVLPSGTGPDQETDRNRGRWSWGLELVC